MEEKKRRVRVTMGLGEIGVEAAKPVTEGVTEEALAGAATEAILGELVRRSVDTSVRRAEGRVDVTAVLEV